MTKLKNIVPALFAGAAMLWVASPASAMSVTTITVTDTFITVDCGHDISLGPNCEGFTLGGANGFPDSAGTLSPTNADLYSLPNDNEATEAQALDILIDGLDDDDFVGADGVRTTPALDDGFSFDSSAEYIVFKVGGGQLAGTHFFLHLLSEGTINIEFEKNGQSGGGGLSHFTEFGIAPVPVPASIWLFGTALIGFIGFARRTKV